MSINMNPFAQSGNPGWTTQQANPGGNGNTSGQPPVVPPPSFQSGRFNMGVLDAPQPPSFLA